MFYQNLFAIKADKTVRGCGVARGFESVSSWDPPKMLRSLQPRIESCKMPLLTFKLMANFMSTKISSPLIERLIFPIESLAAETNVICS